MQYEADDLIGMGDFAEVVGKAKKGAKKFRAWIKRMASKAKGRQVTVKGKTYTVDDSGAVSVAPAAQVEVSAPAGAGAVEWAKKNPLIVGVAALAVVALLMRRKG